MASTKSNAHTKKLDRDALVEFARADFMCFVELTFDVLHPGPAPAGCR